MTSPGRKSPKSTYAKVTDRTSTFTVRAGTVLPDSFVLPETVHGRAGGRGTKAQIDSAARRDARDKIAARFDRAYSLPELRKARAEETKATTPERVRGGRPPKAVPGVDPYGTRKVWRYVVGKPKRDIRGHVRRAVQSAAADHPGADLSIVAFGRLRGYGPDYEKYEWVSTDAFDTVAHFDAMAPTPRALERWLGVDLRGSDGWAVLVYDDPGRQKGRGGSRRRGK